MLSLRAVRPSLRRLARAHAFSTAPAAAAGAPAAAAGMPEAAYAELRANLLDFMHEHIYPRELEFAAANHAQAGRTEWTHPPMLVELMRAAKARGLWNLWLPADTSKLIEFEHASGGLTNLQCAGRSLSRARVGGEGRNARG